MDRQQEAYEKQDTAEGMAEGMNDDMIQIQLENGGSFDSVTDIAATRPLESPRLRRYNMGPAPISPFTTFDESLNFDDLDLDLTEVLDRLDESKRRGPGLRTRCLSLRQESAAEGLMTPPASQTMCEQRFEPEVDVEDVPGYEDYEAGYDEDPDGYYEEDTVDFGEVPRWVGEETPDLAETAIPKPVQETPVMPVSKWYTSLLTRGNMALATILLVMSSLIYPLSQPLSPSSLPPAPSLLQVVHIARSFEPLIYYSEGGASRVSELQHTSYALWDLGHTIGTSDIPSAPVIQDALVGLSEDLNVLAIEMSRFFARVDGDIDNILLVMDWARRELSVVNELPRGVMSSVLDRLAVEVTRSPLRSMIEFGTNETGVIPTLFANTHVFLTRQALEHTFHEVLSVLEAIVTHELARSIPLLSHFDEADTHFASLTYLVTLSLSGNDAEALKQESFSLSNLWSRLLGHRPPGKFEKNRELLKDVRGKTQKNKYILVDHAAKLEAVKTSLEGIRRALVSPVVRANSSGGLEEEIRGVEEIGGYLREVRKEQRGRVLGLMYGGVERRLAIEASDDK